MYPKYLVESMHASHLYFLKTIYTFVFKNVTLEIMIFFFITNTTWMITVSTSISEKFCWCKVINNIRNLKRFYVYLIYQKQFNFFHFFFQLGLSLFKVQIIHVNCVKFSSSYQNHQNNQVPISKPLPQILNHLIASWDKKNCQVKHFSRHFRWFCRIYTNLLALGNFEVRLVLSFNLFFYHLFDSLLLSNSSL